MSDCEFDCDLTCTHCGYRARKPGTRRQCSVDRPLSLLTRLQNYEEAISRWLRAGRPVRSDAAVVRLHNVCESNQCGVYRDGTCGACGCPVSTSRWAVRNKLRMATEKCPKRIWIDDAQLGGELIPPAGAKDAPRLGILTPNLYVGGVESWICSLAREWNVSQEMHLVGVGHVGSEGTHQRPLTDRLLRSSSIVSACDIPDALRVRSPLTAAAAIAEASEVLIVWSVGQDLLARIKRPDLQVIGVSHGCHDWWMRQCAEFVDHWAAVSEDAVKPVPTDPASVRVIPNGIDLDRCRSTLSPAEARERLGIFSPGPIVGYCGRISPEKRVREIAQSAELLPPHWRVLIVGQAASPTYEAEVRAACGPRVTWVNRSIAEVGDVWRACTAAVIASAAEGYCLAAVEALAAGVPLAATRVGVIGEIPPGVEDIAQPAEPAAIAAAVVAAARRGVSPKLAAWTGRQSAARMAAEWAQWISAVHQARQRS